MNKYTVVGITDDGMRVAAWVEADSPEAAETAARTGNGLIAAHDGNGYGDTLQLAGVFAGHLMALDEQ